MTATRLEISRLRDIFVAAGTRRHIAAITVGLFVLFPSRARAESGTFDACSSTTASLPSTLPANVPGIPLHGYDEPRDVTLAGGPSVDVTVTSPSYGSRLWIVQPSKPLVSGTTYTLSWTDCSGFSSTTFTATDPKPLPVDYGTITVGPSKIVLDHRCDALGRPIGAQLNRVYFSPSAELNPFIALTELDLIQGGSPQTLVSDSLGAFYGSTALACPASAPTGAFTVRVRIAGLPAHELAPVSITNECASETTTCTEEDPDAGVVDGDASTDVTDSGLSEETIKAACSASTKPSSAWGLLSILALALVRRARAS